jgi:hypothetical protein
MVKYSIVPAPAARCTGRRLTTVDWPEVRSTEAMETVPVKGVTASLMT